MNTEDLRTHSLRLLDQIGRECNRNPQPSSKFERLAAAIQAMLMLHDLSVKQLAERCELATEEIIMLLTLPAVYELPSLSIMEKIADAFSVAMSDFAFAGGFDLKELHPKRLTPPS